MAKPRFNQQVIIGNLGKDAEIRYTQTQLGILTLTVATNDGYWSTKKNEWIDETTWHRVELMAKEGIEAYGTLRKGDMVVVVGSHRVDIWENREGVKQYTNKIRANIIAKVIELKVAEQQKPANIPQPTPPSNVPDMPEPDDDIPF